MTNVRMAHVVTILWPPGWSACDGVWCAGKVKIRLNRLAVGIKTDEHIDLIADGSPDSRRLLSRAVGM